MNEAIEIVTKIYEEKFTLMHDLMKEYQKGYNEKIGRELLNVMNQVTVLQTIILEMYAKLES